MKHFVLLTFLNLSLIVGLSAQNSAKKQNSPQENSKVTREYDEKGNLIKFDSVYTYSYSGDSTLMKHFSPEDFSGFFGSDLHFFNDSTSDAKSFFEDFDRMFADPFGHFGSKQDSLMMKHFGEMHQFHQFNKNDSIAFSSGNFNDMLGNFFNSPNDSTSVKKDGNIAGKSQPKSMDEMLQMMQQQMKEMEKRHRKFFEENQKQKEF
jgi:hypothetical protein